EWGKAKPARVTGPDIRNLADDRERAILERLVGPRPHAGYYNGWQGAELSRLELRGVVAHDVVPILCGTGRCMLRPIPSDNRPKPHAIGTHGPSAWRNAASGHAGKWAGAATA